MGNGALSGDVHRSIGIPGGTTNPGEKPFAMPWSANHDVSTSLTDDLTVAVDLSGLVNAVDVTNFGDQAVVLPLAIGIALVFAVSGWRRGALAWTSAIGGTLALILLLKVRFFACGDLRPGSSLGNPSGHTAATAAVYGGLSAAIVRSLWNDERRALLCAVAVGTLLAIVIGMTRLMLDLHSMAEVVVGGAIGVGGAASFVLLAGPPSPAVRIERVVATGLLIVAVLYGNRLSAEATIKSIATALWPFLQCI
jgi:membrane-associated phospholipid phosphatase